mgnify:CR=1 FL=1
MPTLVKVLATVAHEKDVIAMHEQMRESHAHGEEARDAEAAAARAEASAEVLEARQQASYAC